MTETIPSYKIGMLVEHPSRPQWGPGKVIALGEGKIYVYFRDELEKKAKTLLTTVVAPAVAESQSDAVLDLLPPATHDGSNYMLPKNYLKLMNLPAK
jgi:hypothetical protein